MSETICSLNFASRCRLTELGQTTKSVIDTAHKDAQASGAEGGGVSNGCGERAGRVALDASISSPLLVRKGPKLAKSTRGAFS